MTKQYLEKALEITKTAVTAAGEELLKHFGKVEAGKKTNTGDYLKDVVTKLDQQTEFFLEQELGKFDSEIGFRGEEFGSKSEGKSMWLVDPIDGTNHYIRGLPFCTTMVSLIEDHNVVMSVIYDFVRKDMYYAIRGQGSYKNNSRIYVSERSLSQSLLSFETRLERKENLSKYLQVKKIANLVQFMTSGYEFVMIASGKLEGKIAIDPYGCDWDFASGSLLVTEAGGVAINIGKSTYDYRNHDFVITNSLVHQELIHGSHAIFPVHQI